MTKKRHPKGSDQRFKKSVPLELLKGERKRKAKSVRKDEICKGKERERGERETEKGKESFFERKRVINGIERRQGTPPERSLPFERSWQPVFKKKESE